jgi:hypothetical protein
LFALFSQKFFSPQALLCIFISSEIMNNEQKTNFVRDGYVHLHRIVPTTLTRLARRVINARMGEGLSAKHAEMLRRNAWSLGEDELMHLRPEFSSLLFDSQAFEIASSVLGETMYLPHYYVQVAIRFPQSSDEPHFLPWHLDNIVSDGIKGFSAVVGVFLSDALEPNSGNFTVFPGGHRLLEQEFRSKSHSSKVLFRDEHGRIVTPPQMDIPERQLLVHDGDIVVAHHQLPHRAAPNVSANIRYAVFFRFYHRAMSYDHPVECAARQIILQNLWIAGFGPLEEFVG